MLLTFLSGKIPEDLLSYKRSLYKEKKWEKGGKIYDTFFHVKKWKVLLPDISDFIKPAFCKKVLKEYNENYLSTFLIESCRSELTHWAIILSAFLFSIWCDLLKVLKLVLLAIILNMPFIIIQRYNRPRIVRLLNR